MSSSGTPRAVRFSTEDGGACVDRDKSQKSLKAPNSFTSRCGDQPQCAPRRSPIVPATTGISCCEQPRHHTWRQRLRHARLLLSTSCKTLGESIRAHPSTLIIPAMVFIALVVAGEMGVWAASNASTRQLHSSTLSVARTTAQQMEVRIQTALSPLVAIDAAIQANPHAPTLAAVFPQLAASILKRMDPNGFIARLQIVPWGIVSGVYPLTPTNLATLKNNIFADPIRAVGTVQQTALGPYHSDMVGPGLLMDGSIGLVGRANVYTTANDSTVGMQSTFTVPYANVTLGNATRPNATICGSVCNPWVVNGTQLNFWGFIFCPVRLTAFLPPLLSLETNEPDYWYILGRRDNPMYTAASPYSAAWAARMNFTTIVAMSNVSIETFTDNQLECTDIIMSDASVLWTLCIVPQDGWGSPYKLPLLIVVPIIALVIAALLFAWMVVHARLRDMLSHMLPERVIGKLALGQRYAESYQAVTILFADIVSYTDMASNMHPDVLVSMLDDIYSQFDKLTAMHGAYKVETIGDAFVAVGGAPNPCEPRDAARRVARLALDMIEVVSKYTRNDGEKVEIRVGINSGDIAAAVVGKTMPHWTLIGDAVNVAARMQSNSKAGHVHVSQATADLLAECVEFELQPRGQLDIKGKGKMATFFLAVAGSQVVHEGDECAPKEDKQRRAAAEEDLQQHQSNATISVVLGT